MLWGHFSPLGQRNAMWTSQWLTRLQLCSPTPQPAGLLTTQSYYLLINGEKQLLFVPEENKAIIRAGC